MDPVISGNYPEDAPGNLGIAESSSVFRYSILVFSYFFSPIFKNTPDTAYPIKREGTAWCKIRKKREELEQKIINEDLSTKNLKVRL